MSARERKPILLHKIDDFTLAINSAILLKEEHVISISEDRSLRVWIKRDNGQYWPSVIHTFNSPAACIEFHEETGCIFVGLDSGLIYELNLSQDLNKITPVREYSAHSARVTGIAYSDDRKWLLSTGRDRVFTWHYTASGVRIGSHIAASWCTCLMFDEKAAFVFVGTYAGEILILHLHDPNGASNAASGAVELIRVLKGHNGSVRSLAWEAARSVLYSGSFDAGINVWDIGGAKGQVYELNGHSGRVQSLHVCPTSKQLVSAGDDGLLIFWQLDVKRDVTPAWKTADRCEMCNAPFFWNWRQIWDEKRLVVNRQHHCRICGKAVCDGCSQKRSTFPRMGYELEQRMCSTCFETIKPEDRVPLATSFNFQDSFVHIHLLEKAWKLLTVSADRVIKIWDVAPVMKP